MVQVCWDIFTALTMCSFYSDGAMRVVKEDWAGLMDIMPTMSKALWVCVILSIIINSISLLTKRIKQLPVCITDNLI